MRTLNILTAIALLFSIQFGFAQSAMKNPVAYQLKNGMTVIVAENSATQKVFANLSFEGMPYDAGNAVVQEVLNTIFTQQLPLVNAGFSYTDKGMNMVVAANGFEQTLADLYTYAAAPEFNDQVLANAKAVLVGHLSAQDKYYPANVTADAVNGIDLAQVKAFYARFSNPAAAYLTVAGNIKPAMVKSFAKRGLDKLKVTEQVAETYLVSNF